MVEAYGLDNLEDNRVLIYMHSVDSYPNLQIPPARNGVVRSEVRMGGFLVEPRSNDSCLFHMMFNIDPKVTFTT